MSSPREDNERPDDEEDQVEEAGHSEGEDDQADGADSPSDPDNGSPQDDGASPVHNPDFREGTDSLTSTGSSVGGGYADVAQHGLEFTLARGSHVPSSTVEHSSQTNEASSQNDAQAPSQPPATSAAPPDLTSPVADGLSRRDAEEIMAESLAQDREAAGLGASEEQEERPPEEFKLPEYIDVIVEDNSGRETVINVHVLRENLRNKKAYLGGFRHKKTGAHFHHASSQTDRKLRTQAVVKFERQTQTIETSTKGQQCTREQGTQMARKDLYVDDKGDRVLEPQEYFTADDLERVREHRANEIQCFIRQCFAYRRVRRLREEKAGVQAERVKEQERKLRQQEEEHKAQIDRRMNPRTKEDFAVLYKELEAWRLHKTQKIKNSGQSEAEINFQLQELLHKEVKLLQTIDRLKIQAAKENKKEKTKQTLEMMASPKEWQTATGDPLEVDTPFTKRARELVELYSGLCLPDLPKEQRLDVLRRVKTTVQEFDCALTREIVDLLKREEHLLRMGRPDKSLEGLRKRISNCFLQFTHTPEFNPESANYSKVPFTATQAANPAIDLTNTVALAKTGALGASAMPRSARPPVSQSARRKA